MTKRTQKLLLTCAVFLFLTLQNMAAFEGIWGHSETSFNTNRNTFNFSDISLSVSGVWIKPHARGTTKNIMLLFDMLNVRIAPRDGGRSIKLNDNYAMVLSGWLTAFLLTCPPWAECSKAQRKERATLAMLFTLPHIIPNLGFGYAFARSDNSMFYVYVQQEMNYYIFGDSGISYGFKTGFRYAYDTVKFGLGTRKYIHDRFNNYTWNPSLTVSIFTNR